MPTIEHPGGRAAPGEGVSARAGVGAPWDVVVMTPSASIADPVSPDPGIVAAPPADVVESPAALGHRFAEAVAAGDLDAIVALYAADAVVTLPEGREAAGTAAIRSAFEAALAAGADLRVASVGRPIVSGPLACTTTVDADGRVHTQVARCEPDGTWRWIRDVSRLSGRAGQGSVTLG